MGKGQTYASGQKQKLLALMAQSPMEVFNCPTRRPVAVTPNLYNCVNADPIPTAARTDYAASSGEGYVYTGVWQLSPTDPKQIPADAYITEESATGGKPNKGVISALSLVRAKDTIDGLSRTYLLGEKYINADWYTNSLDNGDNQPMFAGYDFDYNRWVGPEPADPTLPFQPRRDIHGAELVYIFGSAHSTTFNMSFCDGAVKTISYDISPQVHSRLGTKGDLKAAAYP